MRKYEVYLRTETQRRANFHSVEAGGFEPFLHETSRSSGGKLAEMTAKDEPNGLKTRLYL